MNILFASKHCCIRVYKEAIALMKRGVGVHFLHEFVANGPSVQNAIPSQNFYHGLEQYRTKLGLFRGLDLIHVHNEPDNLVYIAKEVLPDVPLVYDCHDMAHQDGRGDVGEEEKAMKAADGFIFPSKGYVKAATEKWNLPESKPKAVIYPMCLAETVIHESLPKIDGIVYQGGIIGGPDNESRDQKFFHDVGAAYRDFTGLAAYLQSEGILFALYGVGQENANDYIELGALCFGPMSYRYLLKEISRYTWGFVGCVEPHQALKYAMPNKLFEYIAAGVPVIVYNSEEAGEFVKAYGLGIVIDKLEDIAEHYNDHEKYKQNVLKIRSEFTMESQVDTILDVYRELL